jgi:hypothetical protein
MIIPVVYQFPVFGNDSFELTMNWKDEDGNTIDLSGRTSEMKFFVSKTDRTVVKTLTNVNDDSSGIILSSVNPNISVLIVRGETGVGSLPNFTAVPGYAILRIITSASLDDRLLEGRVIYKP